MITDEEFSKCEQEVANMFNKQLSACDPLLNSVDFRRGTAAAPASSLAAGPQSSPASSTSRAAAVEAASERRIDRILERALSETGNDACHS